MRTIIFVGMLLSLVGQFQTAQGEGRLEIQKMRNYHSKTFLNANGSYTTEVSAGYLHYRDTRGDFQEINRQFVSAKNPQHFYEIQNGLYGVCIEKIGPNELIFSFQPQGGPEVRYTLLGLVFYNQSNQRHLILKKVKKVIPRVDGNRLRLENIFPGITLQYTYTDVKFKEEIFFSQTARTGLANPASLGLGNQDIYIGFLTKVEMDSSLEVFADGQKIRNPAAGLPAKLAWHHEGIHPVSFQERSGRPYFHLPVDFAVSEVFQDSAAAAGHSQSIFRKFFTTSEGDFILSMVPLNWLRSQSNGTIIFDPQIVIDSQNNDTWIEYNSPSNFRNYSAIRVGRGSGYNWKRSLLKFNLTTSSLPGNAKIISASCKLYWYTSWKTSAGIYVDRPIFLHQMLREWNESQVDWYEAKTGSNWSDNGVGFNDFDARSGSEDMLVWGSSGFPRWMEYNVTQLVQRWVGGTNPNYGIILWAGNEEDYSNADEKWIYSSNHSDPSKHPKLIINYTLNDLAEFTYTPTGMIDSLYLGKDVAKGNFNYTMRDWINRISYRDINSSNLLLIDCHYDLAGNILSQQYTNLTESDQIAYSYDAVYQLKNANSNRHDDHEFSYDASGNIQSKKVNTVTTGYLYDPNHPNRLQQVGPRYFSYDHNGNVLNDGYLNLEYDYKNQLQEVSGVAAEQYLYDSNGLRVKKSEGISTSGSGYNVTEWNLQLTSAVNGVVPTVGNSMYRIQINTAAGTGDHYTNEKIVIADELDILVTAGSTLEYDIRAGQSSTMRASVQFYYFNPATNQYAYSWDLNYLDQNGLSNKWKTDLNSRYVYQWYHRVLPLTSLQGRIIKKVFFMTNDDPSTTGPQSYTFYCDEIKINGEDLGRANGNAAAPTVFYEDYDDGNIHDGIPVDWFTNGSYWTVSSGNLFWSNWSRASNGQCSHPDLTFDNFEVQFELKADGRYRDQYWAGFAFRKEHYNDWYNTSGYLFYYRYNGEVCLYKPYGNIASVQTGKTLANFHSVKISALGNTIKVYVDGKLYLNITDNTYHSGYFGLDVFGVGARYDNLKISGVPVETEIYYIRDGEGNVIAEYDGLGNLLVEYVYGNNQRLAKINSDRTIDYFLHDHLGSARTMVSSGWSANYYPFGEIASQTGSNEDTHFDFTGQERDRETGLMYFGARYYDPSIGRFLSVDPLAAKYPSLSPYNYCFNYPLGLIDPDGKGPFDPYPFDYYGNYTREQYEAAYNYGKYVALKYGPVATEYASLSTGTIGIVVYPMRWVSLGFGALTVAFKLDNPYYTEQDYIGDAIGTGVSAFSGKYGVFLQFIVNATIDNASSIQASMSYEGGFDFTAPDNTYYKQPTPLDPLSPAYMEAKESQRLIEKLLEQQNNPKDES